MKDEVARFLASSKEDVAWHPCPRVVLAEGEVPSAERLHGLLASSLAATEPFQARPAHLARCLCAANRCRLHQISSVIPVTTRWHGSLASSPHDGTLPDRSGQWIWSSRIQRHK